MSFRSRYRGSLGNTRSVDQPQEQSAQQQTNATRSTQNISAGIKVPILDSHNQLQYTVGDMVLNAADNKLYYHTGHQWIPLAIGNNVNLENNNVVIKAPDTRKDSLSYAETQRGSSSGDICLVAGHNASGIGGNAHISTGQGGIADGEIYFDIGGERALTIKKTGDLKVDFGDVIVQSGNLELTDSDSCINCNNTLVVKESDQTSGAQIYYYCPICHIRYFCKRLINLVLSFYIYIRIVLGE